MFPPLRELLDRFRVTVIGTMQYLRIKPQPALERFVERIWVQENLALPGAEGWKPTRVLPTGKLDLVFFYGDPFVQVSSGGELPLPRLCQTGQWTGPVLIKATGRSGVIVFSFYPWGAYPFCGLPLSEIQDQHLALDQLFPSRRLAEFSDRLAEAGSPMERVRLIEAFLLGILRVREHDALVELAVRQINHVAGNLSIRRLSGHLHLSRRQLVRRFQRTVGVSPKTFARINRFQKAVGLTRLGMGWNSIVDFCGYADQAHFIREIKTFSGFSPRQLQNGRPDSPLCRRFNRPDMSHFFNTVYL